MFIIWLVSWSPGASAGTQITATARTRAATPTTRARTSPRTHSFSASTTASPGGFSKIGPQVRDTEFVANYQVPDS